MSEKIRVCPVCGFVGYVSEAVEVVRCGECKYWKCNPNAEEYGVCKKVSYDDFEVVMNSDDYCSYGVREKSLKFLKNKED